jgi:hypothetical protein
MASLISLRHALAIAIPFLRFKIRAESSSHLIPSSVAYPPELGFFPEKGGKPKGPSRYREGGHESGKNGDQLSHHGNDKAQKDGFQQKRGISASFSK